MTDKYYRNISSEALLACVLTGSGLDYADRGSYVAISDADEPAPVIAVGRTSTYSGPGPHVSADTVYDVASLTKVATVSLLVRLCETGIVSLDDRLVDIVPPLRSPSTEPLTIRQLVGHCSGLPAHVDGDVDAEELRHLIKHDDQPDPGLEAGQHRAFLLL